MIMKVLLFCHDVYPSLAASEKPAFEVIPFSFLFFLQCFPASRPPRVCHAREKTVSAFHLFRFFFSFILYFFCFHFTYWVVLSRPLPCTLIGYSSDIAWRYSYGFVDFGENIQNNVNIKNDKISRLCFLRVTQFFIDRFSSSFSLLQKAYTGEGLDGGESFTRSMGTSSRRSGSTE
jgi:hypothetical protein